MPISDYAWLIEAVDHLPEPLPGALLLYGQRGVGKQRLASALSQSLLCEDSQGTGRPCGKCGGCHLLEIGNHPDFRLLQPEKDTEQTAAASAGKGAASKKVSSIIGVDAVRSLADLTANAAHRGGAKVILIYPAEALNPAASNALLKMLEEPGRDTYFILVASERHRILPTIKSRCFQLAVRVPSGDVAAAWLADRYGDRGEAALRLASNAPFLALELLEDEQFWDIRESLLLELADEWADPLSLAGTAEKLEPTTLGRLLSMWVFDLLVLQRGGQVHYHRDLQRQLTQLAGRIDAAALCHWSDAVREFSRAAEHPLNRRLTLESLFAAWPGSRLAVGEAALEGLP